jgi:hypothetical protein
MLQKWVRLAVPIPMRGLEPGRWYQVVAIDLFTGILQVACEELERDFWIHARHLVLQDKPPTRVSICHSQVRGGALASEILEFVAICPKRHFLGNARPDQMRRYCPRCRILYETDGL